MNDEEAIKLLKRLERTIRHHDYMKTRNMSHRKKVEYHKHVAWTKKAPIADVLFMYENSFPTYVYEWPA